MPILGQIECVFSKNEKYVEIDGLFVESFATIRLCTCVDCRVGSSGLKNENPIRQIESNLTAIEYTLFGFCTPRHVSRTPSIISHTYIIITRHNSEHFQFRSLFSTFRGARRHARDSYSDSIGFENPEIFSTNFTKWISTRNVLFDQFSNDYSRSHLIFLHLLLVAFYAFAGDLLPSGRRRRRAWCRLLFIGKSEK